MKKQLARKGTSRQNPGKQSFSVSEDGFLLLAIGCAMSYGFSFTPKCLHDVTYMIKNGIFEWRKETVTEGKLIRDAQQELIRFVSEMALEAKRLQKTELEELVFATVLKALCPLPPWIKAPCPK